MRGEAEAAHPCTPASRRSGAVSTRASVVAVAGLLALATACSDSDADAVGQDASAAPVDASTATRDASLADAATPSGADAAPEAERSVVRLPDGDPGIGFDDLQYSAALDRVIVPAGRAGYVGLLDPRSEQVTRLGSLSATDSFAGGHGFGTTSAVEAEGLVYAVDRTALELVQLDPDSGEMLDAVALGATPDYVRFVPATRELWVTEPSAERFEIFTLDDAEPPALAAAGELTVVGGPESMAVAADGATAYTNTFIGDTLRIDTGARSESARWRNGCLASLGLTLDAAGERLFVGCAEGKATVVDTADGSELSSLRVGGGVDVIAYSDELAHLYLNGSTVGELTVAAVAVDGTLSELATLDTPPSPGSSCVLGDPHGNVWVCDANAGQLSRFSDVY